MQWREPQAAELAALESLDGYAPLRNGLRRVADGTAEWAGIPMPIDGMNLVIERSYPRAAALMETFNARPEPHDFGDARIRNRFRCWGGKGEIVVWEKDGKIDWGRVPHVNHVAMQFDTMRACDAWGIAQEQRALMLLGSMLSHRMFKCYLLTGMFLETSPRSGVHYVFRKLRPTLALRPDGDSMRILCALCMHPIAYYEGCWAGAMCPTDDVVAHLAMMRGDEVMFWRRCNQHPAWRPEAGIG